MSLKKPSLAGFIKNGLSMAVYAGFLVYTEGWAMPILLGAFSFGWVFILGECLSESKTETKQEKYLRLQAEQRNN